MKIIEGFKKGKALLSRQPSAEFYSVSPSLKARIKKVFGQELTPEQAVRQIIDDVRVKGDAALRDYTSRIDGVELASFEVSKKRLKAAYREVNPELIAALKLAARRIRSFHVAQKRKLNSKFISPGLGWLVRPLERVGLYVPGGTASYPSTVLMTAVPARVAGVKEIVLVTPPSAKGEVPAVTLAAADIAGVGRVFSLGGAQAIAALAYGTESVPKVDKICGPGNIFVVLAKQMVYGSVDIDSLPGPSEVLIIGDDSTSPEYCASDLLAQAEHDAMASAILVTPSRKLANAVNKEVEQQLQGLSRRPIAAEALESNGMIIVVDKIEQAFELANLYAPEHLCLMMDNASDYLDRVQNAGCIIAGRSATVALSDYVAGPSHVLPTGGTARFGSPLNVSDFLKLIDVVNVDEIDLSKLGPTTATIARAEGLEAHARAVERRVRDK
ncbi:MAG: histidinol dehydrogenase [Chloroflexi bacterium]|nr:histidinol dehydrogenase [Chloroflexota bacterium]